MKKLVVLAAVAASLLTAACTIKHDEERVVPSAQPTTTIITPAR